MNNEQVLALANRAYARIGGCGCPPVAELCENCEVLRDMISALAQAYPDAFDD
ncbi:hypothetical protein [Mycobacterium intracellulare]|uniref:hypothetical protein n=1 Tax=Mycobacterium intracellulare TaxID=1767 RepID=UPI002596FECD|nr:hypothetical protein [Mycobacterium intracellulare]MDM3894767.1 hypothetical protein [Mycobacterium intracellulare]